MSTLPPKQLSSEQLVPYYQRLAALGQPIIVGGQAVNYWASQFLAEVPQLKNYAPFTSKDADFLGDMELARSVQLVFGGQLRTAGRPGMHLLARVTFGEEMHFDILRSIRGVTNEEVEKHKVPVRFGSGKEQFQMFMLHPVLCMESRVCNVVEVPDSYDNERGLKQLQASIFCAQHYLKKLISSSLDDKIRKLLKYNERIVRFCTRNESALKLYQWKGIDPSIAMLRSHPNLPERFVTKRLPQLEKELEKRPS